jgi:anhydro-N-acetylmuramic acid kinase
MTVMSKEHKAMTVAGVMSGTSADGIDVAIVRVKPGEPAPKLTLLGHAGFPYPRALRAELLRVMEGAALTAGELSRLNWKLGAVYADCIAKAVSQTGVTIGLVALHGQTIHHEAGVATWQLGEAAVVRERLGVPVVSDFRPADLAAGGQAAPLVPMLDFCQFRSKTRNRVLLNLGGIANLTAIPANATLDDLLAFDTGPANMVIDAVMQASFRKPFDRGGKVAARGRILTSAVTETLRLPYFASAPPKSCGREQFGAAFASDFMDRCVAAGGNEQDAVATATELTAASILDAYGRFCWPHLGQRAPLAKTEVIAAGGGVHNATLMRRLGQGFAALGVKLSIAEDAQAKEAVAFALLGWLTWHGLPGNVPAATGARGHRVLGKISQ